MIPTSSSPVKPPTIEDGINSLLKDTKKTLSDGLENCERRVRESPGQAIALALIAGYLAHRLPIRSLVVSQVKVATALAPPALLAYGAAKLCELLQQKAREKKPARRVILAPGPEI